MDGFESMTTEQIEAEAYGTAPEVVAETVAEDTTPDTESTEAAPDAELPANQGETPDTPTDDQHPGGPGDLRVALRQERAEKAAAKAEAEQIRTQLAEAQQYRQQVEAQQRQYQQQQQAAQTREQLAAQLDFVDGAEAAQIVEQIRQLDAQTYQQQMQHQARAQVFAVSVDLARETYPDFQSRIDLAYQQFGPQQVDAMAIANNPRNPAKWAYEFGKSLDKAANFDAHVAAEVAKALPKAIQEALQKQQAPQNSGHRTIAHVSSQPPGASGPKTVGEMSTEEIEAAAGYNRRRR